MKYVWINPVTDRMYEKDVLEEFLRQHGYKRVEISKDWLKIVREKYKKAVADSKNPVIDVRCPMAAELVRKLTDEKEYEFPKIWPILIHCGIELAENDACKDGELVITTPCQALADLGNSLGYQHVKFLAWNRFLKLLKSKPKDARKEKTPIPLGFFEELGVSTVSLTGEAEIRNYFSDHQKEKIQLIELLYCEGGCHLGDGFSGIFDS